jgi:hypothetical protein
MTDRELLAQALEALLEVNYDQAYAKEVAALSERLAQPEQEPVATVRCINGITIGYLEVMQPVGTKLYTTPPQRKPEQEPVCAHGIGKTKCSFCHQPQPEQEPVAHTLNCTCGAVWDVSHDGVEEMVHAPNPPQRKPLTEKRIEELYSFWVVDCQDIVGFARAVERTVKGEA